MKRDWRTQWIRIAATLRHALGRKKILARLLLAFMRMLIDIHATAQWQSER